MALAEELANHGLPVRAVARRPPAHLPREAQFVPADITDVRAARRALAGASVVYHAASAPYARWPRLLPSIMSGVIEGAAVTGARIVYADNLYAYGPVDGPITEDLPYRPIGPNGRVRAALAEQLISAHQTGTVRATIGRASDYYGPRGLESTAGERLFGPVVRGKPAQLLGDPDQPHTLTYLPDFARGLALLGAREEAAGEVWHVPSAATRTMREFVQLAFETAGREPRLQVLPSPVLRVLALVSPTMRAVLEQQYQRESAWVVDDSKFERAFGRHVTPHEEAVAATLAWYLERDHARSRR
jgi:nucleoside-diphosphate-sugar epimerase